MGLANIHNANKIMAYAIVTLMVLGTLAVLGAPDAAGATVVKEKVNYVSHGTIRINNNTDFSNMASAEGWPGAGTADNPYVISNYDINANGLGDGIFIGNTTVYFIIENCYIHGAQYNGYYYDGSGIELYNVQNGIIENNILTNNGNGITLNGEYLADSESNEIINNTCTDNTVGMWLPGSENNYIEGNIISNNSEDGMELYSNGDQIINNVISYNGWAGIFFGGTSKNNVLNNNTVSHNVGYGMDVYETTGNTISNNTVTYNTKMGIYLESSNNNSIENNTCHNNNYGIYLNLSDNNSIYYNSAYNNSLGGTYIGFSSNNTLAWNNNSKNGQYGVFLNRSSENTLTNNKGINWYEIYLEYSNRNLIENNYLEYNWSGVVLVHSNNNTVRGNSYTYMGENIVLEYSENNTILDNNLSKSLLGLYIFYSSFTRVYNNTMSLAGISINGDLSTYSTQLIATNNTVNGKPVYYYKNEDMNNTTVPAGAGEVIMGNVSHAIIKDENVSYSSFGIVMGFSSNITVLNNSAEDMYTGIYSYYSSHIAITDNNVSLNNAYYGVYLKNSDNISVANNICYGALDGIKLENSVYNTLTNNTLMNNSAVGIYIYENSNYNLVENETLGYNNEGIALSESSNNMIVQNLIYYSTSYGLDIEWNSNGNRIYNNSFYYNDGSGDLYSSEHIQAYASSGNNYWNSSTGYGNYWYAWAINNSTNDQNHDGIVDWPYQIVGGTGAKDYYPLKNATYPIPALAPSAPQNLQYTVGRDYVNLTWSKPLGNGTAPITEYMIYRNGTLIATVPATQLYYNDTNISEGQSYSYYVVAHNSVGNSAKSNIVEVTAPQPVPEITEYGIIIIALLLIGLVRREKESNFK